MVGGEYELIPFEQSVEGSNEQSNEGSNDISIPYQRPLSL